MREARIKFVEDPKDGKFRVELAWSPKDDGTEKENAVADFFKNVLDEVLKGILGEQTGYGEGDSPEEAMIKAFIDRDIGIAGKGENDGN